MRSTRGKDKFYGSYKELQGVIGQTDAYGYWIECGIRKTFYAKDGAVVEWWCTTKTIVFRGNYQAAHKLRDHVALLASPTDERIDICGDAFDSSQRTWPLCFEPDPANDE